MKKTKNIVSTLTLAGILTAINPAIAQTVSYTGVSDIDMVYYGINWLLGFVLVFAVFMLIRGGFDWMRSGGNKPAESGSWNKIRNAIVAVVIVLFIWVVSTVVVTFVFGSNVAARGLS